MGRMIDLLNNLLMEQSFIKNVIQTLNSTPLYGSIIDVNSSTMLENSPTMRLTTNSQRKSCSCLKITLKKYAQCFSFYITEG